MRVLIGIAASLFVMGIGALIVFGAWRAKLSEPEATVLTERLLPSVAVHTLAGTTIEDELLLVGVADPWFAVTLSAETLGRIERQTVEEGDAVERDEELLLINTTALQAELELAEARHELAKQEFERLLRLQEGGISSPQDYDRALSEQKSAAANLRLTQIELNQSVIRAPIPGTIDVLHHEQGEFVSVGTPLARIVQVDRVKIRLGIPERDVVHFEPGEIVALHFDAYPDRSFEGRIHQIATTAEAASRSFVTEIEVDNADGALRPGMVARASLVRQRYENAIAIPIFAVMKRNNQNYVFVEEGERAVERPVRLGFHRGGDVHVMEGLSPGDRLIITGQRELRDGVSLRVRQELDSLP